MDGHSASVAPAVKKGPHPEISHQQRSPSPPRKHRSTSPQQLPPAVLHHGFALTPGIVIHNLFADI